MRDPLVFTQDELEKMSVRDAEVELGNRVYEAAIFLERLENAKKIFGNGHHMAQDISKYATDRLKERWLEHGTK